MSLIVAQPVVPYIVVMLAFALQLPKGMFVSKVSTNHASKMKDGCLVVPDKAVFNLNSSPEDIQEVFNWEVKLGL